MFKHITVAALVASASLLIATPGVMATDGCAVDTFGAILDSLPDQTDNPADIRIITKTTAEVPVCVYDPVVAGSVSFLSAAPASTSALESDTTMYLFAEKTGLEYTSALGSVNLDVLVSELVGGGSRRSLSLTEFFGYTGSNYCGTGWMDTFNACMTSKPCPGGQNSECADGQSCFGGINCSGNSYGSTDLPYSGPKFCGSSWTDASNTCASAAPCPGGQDNECPDGLKCFSDINCATSTTYTPPVESSSYSGPNFCGSSWTGAKNGCATGAPCPGGQNDECPDGESCFGGITCPTPTTYGAGSTSSFLGDSAGSSSSASSYTGPNFCGSSWTGANDGCATGAPCPGAQDSECPDGQSCFGGITCPTPTTYGSTSTSAATSGYTGPNFCGIDWMNAKNICAGGAPCPGAQDSECPDGLKCFGGITCETPTTYGSTSTSTATSSYSGPNFCGSSWTSANDGCATGAPCPGAQDSECPDGQSCFGGITCPTPTTYGAGSTSSFLDDTAGSSSSTSSYTGPNFCGTSWTGAKNGCATGAPCPGAQDSECPDGQSCFGGITCPTPTTYGSTSAATSGYTAPNFCGSSWTDANNNCATGAPCPGAQDSECPDGQSCFGGITCPTPTTYGSGSTSSFLGGSAGSSSASGYTAPNFCGSSWTNANDNCATGAPCPGAQDSECPDGQSCFGGITCPTPTTYGAGSTSSFLDNTTPSYTGPSFCGDSWSLANTNCATGAPCPGGTDGECPGGQSCFGGITCPTPTTYGTGAAPVPNLNFCGPTYDDAEANKCGNGAQACPGGTADECPGSQDCFKVSACPGAAYLATEQESNASVKAVGSSPDASFGNPSSLSASLPDGTYSSYLLHADSPAQSTITALLTGSIRFPGQEVVGIMFSSGALSSTDSIFGLSSTQYGGSSANRGWEVQSEFQDFLTVSESCEVDVSALTCPATTATECAITANLGSEIGAVGAAYSGDEVHDDPFPNINTGTPLNGPNGRDDTTAFLVGGDYLSQIAAEVEGGMVILGDMDIDATGANSLVYAGYGSGIIPHDGTDVIKVGGNINLDRDVAVMDFASGGGIIRYGGSLTGTGTFKMGPQAQAIQDPNLDLSAYVKVLEDLKAKSEYWATFTPNGDFEGYGYGNQATFQAGADNACIQVFTIEAAELDANWGINVKFDASLDDKTILINVNAPPGGVVTVNNLGFIDGAGNLNYAFSSSVIQNIIWNFHDATVLNLGLCDPTSNHCTSGEFMGSIIAPKANIVNMALPGQSGRFATSGTVVHKWGGSEFHNYPFNPPCPLPPPDNLPVPPECTTLPPGQTDAPTSSPKPQGCPTGVTLVGQVGSLGWVSGDGSIPIEIVSADDTTVTFTVSSTWNTANVDKLYTQLEEDANGLPSTACYLEEAVGMSNGETYTAKCSMYSKTAIVDIYVIDEDLSKQNTGKTINVPDCCHSEAGTPQAMHYVAMLQCTPQPCPPGQTSTRRLEGRGNLRAN